MSAHTDYIQDLNDQAELERAEAEERREQREREEEEAGLHRDDDGDLVDANGRIVEDPDWEELGRNRDGSSDDEPGPGY